jgi:hypothetical protein
MSETIDHEIREGSPGALASISSPEIVEVRVRLSRIALWVLISCVVCEISMFILDYHLNYGRIFDSASVREFFSTSREDGLPSWFATSQVLLVALTIWISFFLARRQRGSKWRKRGWFVLAAFFSYMAVDDGAQIHERFSHLFRHKVEEAGITFDFFPSYSWLMIFLPTLAALGVFTLVFLWIELRTRNSRILLVFAFSLLACAVGMDFVEGLDVDHPWNIYASAASTPWLEDWADHRFERDSFNTIIHFSRSVEETIEMFAHSILWYLLLRNFGRRASEVRVRLIESGDRIRA